MAAHNESGIRAEQLSINHLSATGFTILHRNYRYSRFEIDIIATKNNTLHFIEVKSLNSSQLVHPEIHVTKKKFQSVKKAASAFLAKHPMYDHVQFDVLSVVMAKDKAPEFFLIEDVYL